LCLKCGLKALSSLADAARELREKAEQAYKEDVSFYTALEVAGENMAAKIVEARYDEVRPRRNKHKVKKDEEAGGV
jgi:hypothetical protein